MYETRFLVGKKHSVAALLRVEIALVSGLDLVFSLFQLFTKTGEGNGSLWLDNKN